MVGFSRVIDVNATDSVLVGFQRLIENKILSLPIFDVRRNKYIGFLDIVDIVHHFLDSLTETEVGQGFDSFKAHNCFLSLFSHLFSIHQRLCFFCWAREQGFLVIISPTRIASPMFSVRILLISLAAILTSLLIREPHLVYS